MSRFISIGQAAERLGVSISTLRRWEQEGRLTAERTPAGHRRYDVTKLSGLEADRLDLGRIEQKRTIAYARVSSRDQKADLERQAQVLEMFCSARGWTYEVIRDLGSGINDRKKGLTRLLKLLIGGDVGRLVITHKDRLLRFGAELVFSVCEMKNIEVVILNSGDEDSLEVDELIEDVREIIDVFNARLYGLRSQKNKKLIEEMKNAVQNAQAAR